MHDMNDVPPTNDHCLAIVGRLILGVLNGESEYGILCGLACPECWRLFVERFPFAYSVKADIEGAP